MPSNWSSFFCGPSPGDLAGGHDPLLVMLSVAIAAVGSYTALDLSGRVRASTGAARRFWLLLGATAMGGSIWSTHFVAMLAFRLPTMVTYDAGETLTSLAAAIAVSAAGLGLASRARVVSLRTMLTAGAVLGLGVVVMHYTGMAAMEMNVSLTYEPVLFGLSVVIAVAAGTTALWLAFTLDRFIHKISAAVAMAAAIAGMHFTGMAAANFTPLPFEFPYTSPDTSVPLLAIVIAVATFGALALGLFSAAMDRRFSERAEREAANLRENETYLREVLNTAHDVYIATDAAGAIIEWNAEASRVLGWSREEVLGHSVIDMLIPESYRDTARAEIRSYLEARAADAGDARSELSVLRRDGAAIAVEMTLNRVVSSEQVTYHAFLHDITGRKATERELVAAKEMAESSSRAKSLFLAQMSHELRTPLNAIIGFSEIIRDRMMGPGKEDAYRSYAGDIHSSGQHLLEVINDILDLSKAEGGYLDIHARPFDVQKMLARCADTMRELARKSDVTLDVDVAESTPLLIGEERRIRQIVLNLISNAVKFTPAGGRISVRTNLTAAGDFELIVEDSGIGMSAAQVDIALMPFGQVDNPLSRRHEGAGLGLPLAKRFAELHDGTLAVQSTPDAGTRITVTFPKARLVNFRVLAKTA